MTWQNFLLFKHGGKRSGTVAITEERFIDEFKGSHKKHQASLVWRELKEIGILNKKDRLSTMWRVLSNDRIQLTSLKNSALFHGDIINAIEKITNNKDFAESIEAIPDILYRPECSPKNWSNGAKNRNQAGRITNKEPHSSKNRSRQWDVGIKKDLRNHTDATEQNKKEDDYKLEYDHIPSSLILKDASKEFIANIKKAEERNHQALNRFENNQSIARIDGVSTRNQKHEALSQQIQEKQNRLLAEKEKLADQKRQIQKEANHKEGGFWWTITIPHILHEKGKTYKQSETVQKRLKGAHFHRDVSAYLDILEENWQLFMPTQDEYFKALGAFRYMYRNQIKPPAVLNNDCKTGYTSYCFFNKNENRQGVDDLFHSRLKKFIIKREGIVIKEKDEANLPRNLFTS